MRKCRFVQLSKEHANENRLEFCSLDFFRISLTLSDQVYMEMTICPTKHRIIKYLQIIGCCFGF